MILIWIGESVFVSSGSTTYIQEFESQRFVFFRSWVFTLRHPPIDGFSKSRTTTWHLPKPLVSNGIKLPFPQLVRKPAGLSEPSTFAGSEMSYRELEAWFRKKNVDESWTQLSNEKKVTWLFRVNYRGELYTVQLCGDYFINHEIRIPSLHNQDSIESRAGFFCSWLNWNWVKNEAPCFSLLDWQIGNAFPTVFNWDDSYQITDVVKWERSYQASSIIQYHPMMHFLYYGLDLPPTNRMQWWLKWSFR